MGICGLTSEPVLILFSMIYAGNILTLPLLITKKVCLMRSGNTTLCDDMANNNEDYQQEATQWWWLVQGTELLLQFIMVLILGPLSDKAGRRKVMVMVPFANGVQCLINIICSSIWLHTHPAYLVLGSAMSGFHASFGGVVLLSYAHVADKTTDSEIHKRTLRMAFLESSFFLSGGVSGLLASYILSKCGFAYVYVLNLGFNIVLFIYIVLFIDEQAGDETIPLMDENQEGLTRENEDTEVLSYKDVFNVVHHLKCVASVIFNKESRSIALIVGTYCVVIAVTYAEISTFPLYLHNAPFNMAGGDIGLYMAFNGLLRAIGVSSLALLSYYWLHLSDYSLSMVSIAFQIVWIVFIGLARTESQLYLFALIGIPATFASTALRSQITKESHSSRHGTAISALSSAEAITTIAMSFVSLYIYQATLQIYTGISYFILGGVLLLILLVLIVFVQIKKLPLKWT